MFEALRSGIPLHEQISSCLRKKIDSGALEPHAQLPSEHELCDRFGVSRVTVRRALQTLEADGAVYRRQGLGSFVCERRVPGGLVRLTDFAEDMRRAGMEASSRVLHQANEPCPVPVAEHLGVAPGSPVIRLDRIRLGDGEPVALDRTWLPPYYAQLLEGHDLAGDTLYQVLEKEYGIAALSARLRISATVADDALAGPLDVAPGAPLLLIERTSRTLGAKAIYFQRRFYRSDRIAYELEVARDPERVGAAGSAGSESEGMPLREFEPVFQAGSGAS
ncbi:MAG: GntR family transcriptional regulator [Gemmatimonadota bacterium]